MDSKTGGNDGLDRDLTLMKFKAGWNSIRSLALWEKVQGFVIHWLPYPVFHWYQELFHPQRQHDIWEAEQQLMRDLGISTDPTPPIDRTPYLKKEEERLKALPEDHQAKPDEVSDKDL